MKQLNEHITSRIDSGVLVLSLNRPDKLNALTMEMYQALSEGLEKAQAAVEIGAVVIAASGDNFSAGNDIQDFMRMATSADISQSADLPVVRFIQNLVRFDKPLLVAVQGVAVGIGLTLTLHADMVYVASDTLMSAPFVDLGLVPEAGSSMLLPERVGAARASEILLAAGKINAEQAVDWGLANRVLSPSVLFDETLETAKMLASKPRVAMQSSKRLMGYNREAVQKQIGVELKVFFERLQSDEARAAFSSFMKK